MYSKFDWVVDEVQYKLQPTRERNLWWVLQTGCSVPVGMMLVYVNDILVMGTKDVHDGLVARIQQEWKTSKPELVNSDEWVRFYGFEMKYKGEELWVGQPFYL